MRRAPNAFTIVELLVVITIVVILLALLTPALDSAMERTIQLMCQTNTRLWATTSFQYAVDNRKHLPIGRPEGVDSLLNPWQADHLGQFRYSTWRTFNEHYGLSEESGICKSLGRQPADFKPYNGSGFQDPRDEAFSTFIGWVYWANRKPQPAAEYEFPTKLTSNPTSTTLVTCKGYDEFNAGARFASFSPHAQGQAYIFPKGVAYDPPPDGLAVAHLDGSDFFVEFESFDWLYYAQTIFFYDKR